MKNCLEIFFKVFLKNNLRHGLGGRIYTFFRETCVSNHI